MVRRPATAAESLEDALRAGSVPMSAAALGVDSRQVYRWRAQGVTWAQADELAIRVGLHPGDVWGRAWWELVDAEEGDEHGPVDRPADRGPRRWEQPVVTRRRDPRLTPSSWLGYSPADAAEAVGVSETTIRRLVAEGHLPVVPHLGRRIVIPIDRLREWVYESAAPRSAGDVHPGDGHPVG